MKRHWRRLAGLALALCGLLAALLYRQTHLDAGPPSSRPGDASHGAYLARIGNCAGCHTARGGLPLAGGRGIPTPFGTVFSSNLTPDPETGLGRWSADDFWRALHLGQSRDGRLLSPAFPYENTTHVTRADADDLFAWLRSQAPVRATARPAQLRWPAGSDWALAVWRTLYFRPGTEGALSDRGAYLAQGLAHCSACHARRDPLGGSAGTGRFDGGLLAGLGWVAPSLHDPAEAGVQRWPTAALKAWLRGGQTEGHAALGPMAEVILGSTAALDDADLAAMTAYLQALPERTNPRPAGATPSPARRERGAGLYREHCAACHGARGEGGRLASGELAYPALAGHRTVTQASAQNLLRVIDRGAFGPATPGHPRPFGMPPFAGRLSAEELAALASFLRQDLGPGAGEIDSVEVLRLRERSGSH